MKKTLTSPQALNPMQFFHVTAARKLGSIRAAGLNAPAYLISLDSPWAEDLRDYYVETIEDDGDTPVVLEVLLDSEHALNALEPDFPGIEEPLSYTLGTTDAKVWQAWGKSKRDLNVSLKLIGTCRSGIAIPVSALSIDCEPLELQK